jgi:hypothetical protein
MPSDKSFFQTLSPDAHDFGILFSTLKGTDFLTKSAALLSGKSGKRNYDRIGGTSLKISI